MNQFTFITADGNNQTSGFEILPVYFPTTSGSKILTGDVITSSVSPASLNLSNNTYKVEYNDNNVNNTWYISTSGSNLTLLSGSTSTGSLSTVTFNLVDMGFNPSTRTVELTPLTSASMFNGKFVCRDTLEYTTDATGSLVVNLIPMAYKVFLKSNVKSTTFTILPVGSACNAKDIIVSSVNVASVITPINSANYSYTAQASDNRYLVKSGSLLNYTSSNAVSSSYAKSASYAATTPNLLPKITNEDVEGYLVIRSATKIVSPDDGNVILTNEGDGDIILNPIGAGRILLNASSGDIVATTNGNISMSSGDGFATNISSTNGELNLTGNASNVNITANNSGIISVTNDDGGMNFLSNGTIDFATPEQVIIENDLNVGGNIYCGTKLTSNNGTASYAKVTNSSSISPTLNGVKYSLVVASGSGQQPLFIDTADLSYNQTTGQTWLNSLSASSVTASLNGTASNAVTASVAISSAGAVFNTNGILSTGVLSLSSAAGNAVTIVSPNSTGGGAINLTGGNGSVGGGGAINLTGGNGGAGVGGSITLKAGSLSGTGAGGSITLIPGSGSAVTGSVILKDTYQNSVLTVTNNTCNISGAFNVAGNISASVITASLFNGTASYATNSTTANTASYANTFTVGTINSNGAMSIAPSFVSGTGNSITITAGGGSVSGGNVLINGGSGGSANGGSILIKPAPASIPGSASMVAPSSPAAVTVTNNNVTLTNAGGISAFVVDTSVSVNAASVINNNLRVTGSITGSSIQSVNTVEQLRLGYNTSNYCSTTVNSNGSTTFNAVGTSPVFTFNQPISVSSITASLNGTASVSSQSISSSFSNWSRAGKSNDYDNGLVMYIPFSEGTGSTLSDYSPSGYNFGIFTALTASISANGVPNSSSWSTQSKAGGYSLGFDGAYTYATCSNIPDNFNKISIGVWINTTASIANNIYASHHYAGTSGVWYLRLNNTNQIQFTTINNVANRVDFLASSPKVNDGNWHYVLTTYNGTSGQTNIYFDGLLIGNGTTQSGSLNSYNAPVILGGFTGINIQYAGLLDEFKIWNRDLSADEARAIWDGASSINRPYVNATGSLSATGSLQGTASWANTASYAMNIPVTTTGSLYQQGYILTGSYSTTVSGSTTLSSNHNGKLLIVNSGSLVTLTAPSTLPQGFACSVFQSGSGQAVVVGSGVNIRNRNNLSASFGQYSLITLLQIDATSMLVQGDLG